VKYYGLKSRIEELQKQGKEVNEFYLKGLERFKQKAEKAEGFIKKYNLKNPEEIRDASIRFVLDNPDVSTVCCSMKNFDDVERFVSLSGTGLSYVEKKKLTAYKKSWGELYCRHACGICETSCPNKVPVNTIMRYNHYFDTQARERYAMAKYAEIPGANAKECFYCTGLCESACPYNLPVQGMLTMAHEQLSLA